MLLLNDVGGGLQDRRCFGPGVAYSASCAVIEFDPPHLSRNAMPVGTAVITNINAIVVSVISTLLRVGFDRKAPL